MSRELTPDTSLRNVDVETTAPPLSQAHPPLAVNASLTSQQRDTAMVPEPPQPVVLASSSPRSKGTLVSLPLQLVEEINGDVHPHPGPVAPSLQYDVRSLMSRFPPHCSDIHDQFSSAYLQPRPTRNVAPMLTQTPSQR